MLLIYVIVILGDSGRQKRSHVVNVDESMVFGAAFIIILKGISLSYTRSPKFKEAV